MRWRDFDRMLWMQLVQEARDRQLSELPAPIFGSDGDAEVVAQAAMNAHACGTDNLVRFDRADLSQIEPPSDCGLLICNPPYGERLGEVQVLGAFYKQLGDVLKQRFKGWTAFILTGNKELGKCIGLRAARRIPVNNGSIACTFLKYELY